MSFRKLISGVLAHGSHYLLSSAGVTVINLVSLPIYTRLFAPAEFGLYFTLVSISQLLIIPFTLSLDSALARFYFEDGDTPMKRRELVSSYLNAALLWNFFLFLMVSLVSPWTLQLRLQIPYFPLVFLTLLVTFAQCVLLFLVAILRMEMKSKFLGWLNFLNGLLILLLTTAGSRWGGLGIESRLLAQVATNVLFILIVIAYLIRRTLWGVSLQAAVLNKGLRFSLPLLVHLGSGWISSLSDRLLLGLYNMRASLSFYSLGYDLIRTSTSLISDSIFQIYDPIFLKEMNSGQTGFMNQHGRFLTYYLLVIAFATFAVSIFSPEIIALLTPKNYAAASHLMPIIAYAYLMGALYKPFSSVLIFMKKTLLISMLGIVSAVTNLTLNLILIPRYGSLAAAWTTFLSVAVYFSGTVYFAQRLLWTPVELGRLMKIILANLVVFGLYEGLIALTHSWIGLVVGKIACLMAFPLLLVAAGFFTSREWSLLVKVRDPRALLASLLQVRHQGLAGYQVLDP